jgi:hypothetical protein
MTDIVVHSEPPAEPDGTEVAVAAVAGAAAATAADAHETAEEAAVLAGHAAELAAEAHTEAVVGVDALAARVQALEARQDVQEALTGAMAYALTEVEEDVEEIEHELAPERVETKDKPDTPKPDRFGSDAWYGQR